MAAAPVQRRGSRSGFLCRFSDAVKFGMAVGAEMRGVRKAPRDETARRLVWMVVQGAYGDLSAARNFRVERFFNAVGIEHVHNLDVTARRLLYGESMFLKTSDFKGLSVAKRALLTTCAL